MSKAQRNFDESLSKQYDIVTKFNKLFSNYKKDSDSRKTEEYLNERLNTIAQLLIEFKSVNTSLVAHQEAFSDNSYFASDYFKTTIGSFAEFQNTLMSKLNKINGVELDTEGSKGLNPLDPPPQPADRHRPSVGEQLPNQNLLPNQTSVEERAVRTINATINDFDRYIGKTKRALNENQSRLLLLQKQRGLEKYWHDFSQLHAQIMGFSMRQNYNEQLYEEFEEEYETVMIAIQERIDTNVPKSSPASDNSQIKLPAITLPTFDGNYLTWRSFHDLFKQLVHEQNISGAQKLHYLQTNLSGEPKNLIKHLSATDDNYCAAWTILNDRYDNQRLLVTAQLNQLVNQSACTGDSVKHLKRLHDITRESLQAISSLGVNIDNWDVLVIHMLLQKLDKDTRYSFEQGLRNPKQFPTIDDLLSFLQMRFQTLESCPAREEKRKMTALVASNAENGCHMCKSGDHKIYKCPSFLKLVGDERIQMVKKLQICFNCLKAGHYSKNCASRNCNTCNSRHNSILHDALMSQKRSKSNPSNSKGGHKGNKGKEHHQTVAHSSSASNSSENQTFSVEQHASVNTTNGINTQRWYVCLPTAVVNVESATGTMVPCRVLLDSGSQLNFITTKLALDLGLNQVQLTSIITGIGATRHKATHATNIRMLSRTSKYSVNLEAVVIAKISGFQPTTELEVSELEISKEFNLADPLFYKPQQIDMLLGADLFFEIFNNKRVMIENTSLSLQSTKLGWVVSGRVPLQNIEWTCNIATKPSLTSLEKAVQKLWESEAYEIPQKRMTEEERACEQHFQENVSRDASGKFMVRLPFKRDSELLGESREMAYKRFISLERKLHRNPELQKDYSMFMEEYQSLQHMALIDINKVKSPYYMIPHHCVLKPESTSTKLRVVFDASAKTNCGKSLNDILMVGPVVQPDLFSIIVNFRIHRYVFTGDITKMYRQVLVHPDDRKYQLIFWRQSPKHELKVFQLNTVTYGTGPASFLSTRCLEELANAENKRSPEASHVLKNCMYVDDCLAGARTISDARQLLNEVIKVLKRGQFELRKFCSNHPEILKNLPDNHKEKLFTIRQSDVVKTLGLIWEPKLDQFKYDCPFILTEKTVPTKRTVLSNVAKLFDPLGLIGPVILLGKLFMQELWKHNIEWDEPIPNNLSSKWNNYLEQLKVLETLSFPRHVLCSSPVSIQLHAFSDSSNLAYGACCYVRTVDEFGMIKSALLCSKSRVASLKATTIARLELLGAVLMVELVDRILKFLMIEVNKVCYHTDSTTVLAWINSPSYCWTTYVANRVAKIQALSEPSQWHHIEGNNNPADIISRGCFPAALATSKLWFTGPEFLSTPENVWVRQPPMITENPPEKRAEKSVLMITCSSKSNILINQIDHRNSFKTILNIFSFIFRFINNSKLSKNLQIKGSLKFIEIDNGLSLLLKCVQKECFNEELITLQKGHIIHAKSSIIALNPYIDSTTGLMRVGGRLQRSSLAADAKNPILLPANHIFSKLLLKHLHLKYSHTAQNALIHIARQNYWIIGIAKMARQTVRNCLRCFKVKPSGIDQLMGQLPEDRVNPSRPFHISGVDFCGPIYIHYRIRGKRPTKAYVSVFICFTTKAVHLEIVSDLTTEAFLNALKRFIGRRGICRVLYCDNATNFVGARNQLAELSEWLNQISTQDKINSTCAYEGISWKHIPPRSPHFGGLWEAAVKSAKYLLTRQIDSVSLTYEELNTVIIQIESILNSRPLTPMSSDPNDLSALTPGHFLIGAPLTSISQAEVDDSNMNRLSRYHQMNRVQQQFWKRWSNEYLSNLQQRSKWKTSSENVKIGTLVLLREPNLPPMKWKMGRILEVHPGNDNLIRVVTVKTQTGILKRAIQNLCPLPIDDNLESNATKLPINDNLESNATKLPTVSPLSTSPKMSAVLAILLVLFVLPVHPLSTRDVTIKNLNNSMGLYFEDLGNAQVIHGHWTVFVYYNLSNHWNELETLNECVNQLEKGCNKIARYNIQCSTIIPALKMKLELIKETDLLLRDFNSNKVKGTRKIRSPFDIVGNMAHGMFGILDQEYAQHIESQVKLAFKNEEHLQNLIQNQTMVMDSTLNLMKKNSKTIENQFSYLKATLIEVNNITKAKFDDLEKINLYTSLVTTLILSIESHQRVQDLLLNVILDVHHGKVNPNIITPQQLETALRTIRENLPIDYILPRVRSVEIYKFSTVKARLTQSGAVFELKIPLLNELIFQVFNIIQIPIRMEKKSYIVETSSKYLAVTFPRDAYFIMNSMEFKNCLKLSKSHRLCSQIHPIHSTQSEISRCEIGIINQRKSLEQCKLNEIPDQDKWIQLANPNSWIFSVNDPTTINVMCDEIFESRIIIGNGLMELKPPCTVKTETLLLRAHLNAKSELQRSFAPTINLESWHWNVSTHIETATMKHFQFNMTEIHQLTEQLQHIKQQASTLPSDAIDVHHIHHYAMMYIIIAVLAVIVVVYYARWKSSQKQKCPIPARRLTTLQTMQGDEI